MPREFSVDLWDWTPPCRDLATFKVWAKDLQDIGVTRVEISAPWNLLEPQPHKHDLSFIVDRWDVVRSLGGGIGMRVRINSFYNGATPAWYEGERWKDVNGAEPKGTPNPPSIVDERFWNHFAPLCTAIAERFRDENVVYSPFIGPHAELKYGDWWTYDEASLSLWRRAIKERPDWLRDVAGDAPLPEKPPVPSEPTTGSPDNSPVSKAFIALREQCWRDAVKRFGAAIRAGDPRARTSAPLGESFRRESAKFSNLHYFGLSRGADQVVHSYDFYWHAKDDPWYAAAAAASFRGITGLPVVLEFDGPNLVQKLGYDEAHQLRIADAALSEGAGLKAANYSGDAKLPSEWPVLRELAKRARDAKPFDEPPAERTILLFVSKWANYCYREKSEWLHDAQFGAWHVLRENGHAVRFVCEDNLGGEDLGAYRAMYVAFSPMELMPERDASHLGHLAHTLPTIIETPSAPPVAKNDAIVKADGPGGPFAVTAKGLPTSPCDTSKLGDAWKSDAKCGDARLLLHAERTIVLGYPLAYVWLKGDDRAAQTRVLEWALNRLEVG